MAAWIHEALETAEDALSRAGVRTYEIAASELFSAAVEAMDGKVHVAERSIDRSLGIRILDGGIGFAGISEALPDDIARAIDEARQEARRSRRAAIEAFAAPTNARLASAPYSDPRATGTLRPILETLALELEAKTLAARPAIRRVRPARVEEEIGRFAIRTSEGLDIFEPHSRAFLTTGAVAEDEGGAQSSYAAASAEAAEALAAHLDATADEAADAAARLLGAEPILQGRLPVVFGFEAAADLVALLAGALEADRLERGASPFAGRLGQAVLSPLLTLADDPRDGSLDGACLFDGEGLTTRANVLIDRGSATSALDDRETATRSGRAPNAEAVRGRAGDRPVPGVHSLVLRPGTASALDLLGSAAGGLYVHELSGTHTVNEVTGEFSLGAKGWRVTGSACGAPVEGVTVSGRLLDLLSGSVSLSRETRRLGAFLVPLILIGEVQVSS